MPLVLVGPSGVGKGRLIKSLLKDYNRFFTKIVTHTTRNPRPGEVDGISYNFIKDKSVFQEMVKQDAFLEHAYVHGNYYGTSVEAWKEAQRAGKISIMEIDVQGARSIKAVACKYGLKPKFVFISPPAIEKLRSRLLERGTETEEQINLRVKNAEAELQSANDTTLFDKVLVNDDFNDTVNSFFRLMRNWYPALPSAARLRMLQRRVKNLRAMATENKIRAEAESLTNTVCNEISCDNSDETAEYEEEEKP